MKKIIVAISLVILTAITAAGCVNEPDIKVEPVALVRKAPEAPPVPLDQILADNSAAISFAVEPKDFLEGDKYLAYVIDAKERDAAEEAKKIAQALQAAVDQAQAALNSPVPSVSPSQAPQTSSGTGSQPATGGSSSGGTGSGGAGSGGQTTASARYYNTTEGYSIEFPPGWTKVETTFNGMKLIAAVSAPDSAGDKFAENIGVAVQDLPLALNSEEYLGLMKAGLKATTTDFKEIERSSFKLDGKDGKKLVFSYTLNGQTLEDAVYEVVNGLKAYVIVGAAQSEQYSKYSGAFDTSAGTFKFESGR